MGIQRVGWPENSSYTVHFPSALISMSTVKVPPMSRWGVDRRGKEWGQRQSKRLSCAVKMPLKSDLYTSQNAKTVFMSSMCLLVEDCHVDPNIWQKVLFEWRLSDVVTTMNTNGGKRWTDTNHNKIYRFYYSQVLTEGYFFSVHHTKFHVLTEPKLHTIPSNCHSFIPLELFLNE